MDITYLIKLIKSYRRKGKTVFVCGNGGSAANAEHFTNDLFKKGVKAVCLNSNMSLTTMIANDYGYSEIFSRQLDVFASSEDLLIVISCSGISDNIIQAMERATSLKMGLYVLPTFTHVRTYSFEDYGLLENKHLQLIHKVTAAL